MKSGTRAIISISNLAFRLIVHFAKRGFTRSSPGAQMRKFILNYADDNLEPLSAPERETLLDAQKCINCGACASVCPVIAPAKHGSYRSPASITAALSRSFPDLGAARDAVYNCTQCGACALACPRSIDVPGLVLRARRKTVQVVDASLMRLYHPIVEKLATSGNVYGETSDEFSGFRKKQAEIVYFIGCTGAYRTTESTLATLDLLRALDVDFTVIEERCCGGFHNSVGIDLATNDGARVNVENILASGAKKIITGCPHCMDVMKHEEPYRAAFEKKGIMVEHSTEFLAAIDFKLSGTDEKVAYHDPCFLGRRGGVYDAPRELISRSGCELIEQNAERENTPCCGSRDGTFIIDETVARSLAASRVKQIKDSGADVLLTACPACLCAFEDTEHEGIELDTVTGYAARFLKAKNLKA